MRTMIIWFSPLIIYIHVSCIWQYFVVVLRIETKLPKQHDSDLPQKGACWFMGQYLKYSLSACFLIVDFGLCKKASWVYSSLILGYVKKHLGFKFSQVMVFTTSVCCTIYRNPKINSEKPRAPKGKQFPNYQIQGENWLLVSGRVTTGYIWSSPFFLKTRHVLSWDHPWRDMFFSRK